MQFDFIKNILTIIIKFLTKVHLFFIKSYKQKLWIGINFSGDNTSHEDATCMSDFCEPICKAIKLKSGVCHKNLSVKRSPLKNGSRFQKVPTKFSVKLGEFFHDIFTKRKHFFSKIYYLAFLSQIYRVNMWLDFPRGPSCYNNSASTNLRHSPWSTPITNQKTQWNPWELHHPFLLHYYE